MQEPSCPEGWGLLATTAVPTPLAIQQAHTAHQSVCCAHAVPPCSQITKADKFCLIFVPRWHVVIASAGQVGENMWGERRTTSIDISLAISTQGSGENQMGWCQSFPPCLCSIQQGHSRYGGPILLPSSFALEMLIGSVLGMRLENWIWTFCFK